MQRHLLLYLLLLLTTVSSSGQIEFHFYNKDHLGNVREVVDTHGNVEQVVHYYPSGTPFTDGSGEHPACRIEREIPVDKVDLRRE